jgi:hypothetical protein
MPTADQHRQIAEHNLRFLETIDADEFCDWLAVVAFYIAVHRVEQLGAAVNHHSEDHGARLEFVRQQHPAIHHPYRELYVISLRVRYEAGPHHWLTPEFVSGCLTEIEDYVRDQSGVPPP